MEGVRSARESVRKDMKETNARQENQSAIFNKEHYKGSMHCRQYPTNTIWRTSTSIGRSNSRAHI